MVGLGYTADGYTSNVEVIDLSSSSTACPPFPAYPLAVYGAVGGLGFSEIPHFAGGFNGASRTNYVYYFQGSWKYSGAMGMAREFGAIASFPYSQTDKRFFVAGGFGLNKAEIAYSGGWGATADIPVTVNFHCVVSFNSTTFLLIGGYQNGTTSSKDTYFYNAPANAWSEGPKLKYGRQGHSCARIRSSLDVHGYDLVVVGGTNGTSMASTEIFDFDNSVWRSGPNLPLGVSFASLVEDRAGGVILLAGYSGMTKDHHHFFAKQWRRNFFLSCLHFVEPLWSKLNQFLALPFKPILLSF